MHGIKAIVQALENVKDLKPMPHVTGESEFNALAEKASLLLDQNYLQKFYSPGKSIEEKNEIDWSKEYSSYLNLSRQFLKIFLGMFGEMGNGLWIYGYEVKQHWRTFNNCYKI